MNASPNSRSLLLSATATALSLLPAAAALAQREDVGEAKETNTWIAMVVAIGLVICVAIGTFMSPRRGHQD